MKKCLICFMAAVLVGCSSGDTTQKEPTSSKIPNVELVGDYRAQGEDADGNNLSVYMISFLDDGTFAMFDADAGEPSISGTYVVDGDKVTFYSEETDFNPPLCWYDMPLECALTAQVNDQTLELTYNEITITFEMEESSLDDE